MKFKKKMVMFLFAGILTVSNSAFVFASDSNLHESDNIRTVSPANTVVDAQELIPLEKDLSQVIVTDIDTNIIRDSYDINDGNVINRPDNVVEFYVPSESSDDKITPFLNYSDITVGSGVAAMFTSLNGHGGWFAITVPSGDLSKTVEFSYKIKNGPATYSYGYVKQNNDGTEKWTELGRGKYYGGEHKVRIYDSGNYKFYVKNEQSDKITIQDGRVFYD